ncbi:hypothetical protein PISL3812_05217 [Talaromyces islandicus]|uniref:Uncharacterized protein n=1 Tax=Talaromyces islandicus TaxID=28573 RepID=A0A0U1LZM8_TALIS|nr:hypothetical protein PISL3812_05217 [Talaromyces islandicus]
MGTPLPAASAGVFATQEQLQHLILLAISWSMPVPGFDRPHDCPGIDRRCTLYETPAADVLRCSWRARCLCTQADTTRHPLSMGKRSLVKDVFARSRGQPVATDDPDRPRPGPPPRRRSTSIPVQRDEVDGRNKPSRSRRNGSVGFEDVSPSSSMVQDPGYDADVEVVRPYAIEEPDDDADQTSASASTRPATPKRLDSTEYWQKELVNCLRGLACDSDSNEAPQPLKHKRGRKRKTDTSREPSQSFRIIPGSGDEDVDLTADEPVSWPKRPRRKSTKAGDDIKTACNPVLVDSNSNSTPSSAVLACHTEEQTVQDSTTNTSPADQMDLD